MIPIVPEPPPEIRASLQRIAERAVAGGAPAPSWMTVADGTGTWLREIATAAPARRAAAVAAVEDETALLRVAQLGFGGALWLPPSTVAMAMAFEAAASGTSLPPVACDPRLAELAVGDRGDLAAVTFADTGFWRLQLGLTVLLGLLREVAERLGATPVIIGWPALLVAEADVPRVREVWEAVAGDLLPALRRSLAVVAVETGAGPGRVLPEVLRALAGHQDAPPPTDAEAERQPVNELPGGRCVGWWRAGSGGGLAAGGWTAVPGDRHGAGFRWRLHAAGGEGSAIEDVSCSSEVGAAPGAVVRVAGWAAAGMRAGSPAGLLVERLAGAARRARKVLWVTNVDQPALQHLLRLGGRLWVDGPAVPGER